jgi:hypothetical protein
VKDARRLFACACCSLFALFATACAQNKSANAPSSAEAQGGARTADAPSPTSYGMTSSAGLPQPTAMPSPPPATAPMPRSRDEAVARFDLMAAEREFLASGSDCAIACRALGGLERAASHLCVLVEDAPPLCSDARDRVYNARDQVRAQCSVCPGGPSLDRSAPIPSSPVR